MIINFKNESLLKLTQKLEKLIIDRFHELNPEQHLEFITKLSEVTVDECDKKILLAKYVHLTGYNVLAKELLKQTKTRQTTNIDKELLLAALEVEDGEITSARERYLKILQSYPSAIALINLAEIDPKAVPLEIVKRTLKSRSSEDRINSLYAWARILDSSQNYLQAYATLEAISNEKDKSQREKLIDNELNRFNAIKSYWNNVQTDDKSDEGENVKNLLIVGIPRSGTTLLSVLLSNHDEICNLSELNILKHCLGELKSTQFNGDELNKVSKKYKNLLLRTQKVRNVRGEILLDKMPSNFRYLGFLLGTPENGTKVINIIRKRDPNLISLFMTKFDSSHNDWSDDIKTSLEYFEIKENYMLMWHTLFPNKILDIHYENLISDPVQTLKKIYNWLNMMPPAELTRINRNSISIKTASKSQIGSKIRNDGNARSLYYSDIIRDRISLLGED